jgi:acid stress-induced BolA-like protein IbaG/YrbA
MRRVTNYALWAFMSDHPTDFQGSVLDAIRQAITQKLPDAVVDVDGGGGHYTIAVVSTGFAGKSMLESQRAVYAAISHLMSGDRAPVHAVDSLKTSTPRA